MLILQICFGAGSSKVFVVALMKMEHRLPIPIINQRTSHKFEECSELLRETLSSIGIFSCSACDQWRNRIHSKGGKVVKRRDFFQDHQQCSRPRLKMGPIRVRVVFNGYGGDQAQGPQLNNSYGTRSRRACTLKENVKENHYSPPNVLRCQAGRKKAVKRFKHAKSVVMDLNVLQKEQELDELMEKQ